MDFFHINTKETKGILEVRPDFVVGRSKDLMVRGQAFYAVWDDAQKIWTTDEYEVRRLVDEVIREHVEKLTADGTACDPKYLRMFSNGGWAQFKKYMKSIADNSHQLDATVAFADGKAKKTAYNSRRLTYSLDTENDCPAWDELVGTLYAPEEREKIEWMIGAVFSGDSKTIEKFLVLYGDPGAGKGTILKVVLKLFGGLTADGGYCTVFVAKDLVGVNSNFATEPFKDNPLVAIQFDGDLSRIEDNSKLNSIVSHEPLRMNEKFKPTYTTKVISTLFMGTNTPVQITNAKSGIIRRLIDVEPTGVRLETNRYNTIMSRIDFELGAIASHCLDVYRQLGKNYYSDYQPISMMYQTDAFLNFVSESRDVFEEQDGITLNQAYLMYKEYCDHAELKYKQTKYKFRDELKNYFHEFVERKTVDGVQVWNYYSGFKGLFVKPITTGSKKALGLVLDETVSLLDEMLADQPAQYSNRADNPAKFWTDEERMDEKTGNMFTPRPDQVCSTVLSDLDTKKLHFVKLPENHIVIDFDIKGDDGGKSQEKNLEAAATWPRTYTEFSKSGNGVHLHYIYEGDVNRLASKYSDDIEVKVFRGNASLRRRLSKCNNVPVVTINGGLPLKEKKNVSDIKTIQSERNLRSLLISNLDKQYHSSTKSSIDFIKKILDDAYSSSLVYDVTDMRSQIIAFAADSSNQSLISLKTVQKMKFKSEESGETASQAQSGPMEERKAPDSDAPIAIYDVEVFPNLFVVCYSFEDSDTVIRMINPKPHEIEQLLKYRLVGFFNLEYDNHILYAAAMGYNNEQLYRLSQRLVVENDRKAKFGEAVGLSYADIYDFASIKMSLKKWEIELGIHHMELNFPWDKPVDEKDWPKVVEYCANDVTATKAVLKDRKQDLLARQILANMSGLSVNTRTRQHVAKIMFGKERNPQKYFNYTDLSEEFPGYEFDEYSKTDKSTYKGETVGEGGYVYAEPGMYENVDVYDIASMHPTTIEVLEVFGKYTKIFSDIKAGRLALKRGQIEEARRLLPGALSDDPTPEELEALSEALKLVINSTYGWTAATFANEFRDPRNKDNIVAKRGALFMVLLKKHVQAMGYQVIHIKTDSIKVADATEAVRGEIKRFGEMYGYTFEHEATYKKMCLVNDAVFIARVGWDQKKGDVDYWKAVGAQFQNPYVFKKLFSNEVVNFRDICVARSVVKGHIFLDFDEDQATPNQPEKGMVFVGRTGLFVPVTNDGATLRKIVDDKSYAVAGTKGYKWHDAEVFKNKHNVDAVFFDVDLFGDAIDMKFFTDLAHDAISTIEKYGNFEEFVSDDKSFKDTMRDALKG